MGALRLECVLYHNAQSYALAHCTQRDAVATTSLLLYAVTLEHSEMVLSNRFDRPCAIAARTRFSFISGFLASLLSGCAALPIPHADGLSANTLDGSPGITVYAAGDIADCRKNAASDSGAARTGKLIATALAGNPTAMVLALGDLAYPAGTAAQFDDCYGRTWGSFKDRTLPAPGNHEYYTPGATGYFDYFGNGAGPDRRGYYSTDLGGWHVVSLNSNLKGPASDAQMTWLRADLAASRQVGAGRCVLAFWHHPYASSGGHGNNAHMRPTWEALFDARADVVLAAHDHDYERFAPMDGTGNADARSGIRSFVVGNGGASLTPFGPTKLHSQAQDNSTVGVLRLRLKAGSYEWAFLPADGSAARDGGSGVCHAGSSRG